MKIEFYHEGLSELKRFTVIALQFQKHEDNAITIMVWFMGFGVIILLNEK